MKRVLAPLPANVTARMTADTTAAQFPKAIDANEVIDTDGTRCVAAYFNDGDEPSVSTVSSWRAAIAAATPQPDTERQDATAIVDRIAQAQAKARAILADPVNAADFTIAERKVLLAALALRVGR